MSGTVTIVAALQVEHGTFKFPRIGTQQLSFTQANPGGGVPGTVAIGEDWTLVDLSSLDVPGFVRMQNVDAHVTVQFGFAEGSASPVAAGRMEPGEPALFRLDENDLYMRILDGGSDSESGGETALVQVEAMES